MRTVRLLALLFVVTRLAIAQIPTQLVLTVPGANQTNVGLDRDVTLTFSRPLLQASVNNRSIYVQDPAGRTIADQRSWSSHGATLTLRFPGRLPASSVIRVWIDGGLLQDIQGGGVDPDGDGVAGGVHILKFTTGPVPQPTDNPQPARVLGRVFDTSTPPRPVAGAVVRAWRYPRDEHLPPLPVPSGISDANGEFSYSTPEFVGQEDFLIEIKKPGFSEALRHVTVMAGGTWHVEDARVMPLTPPVFVPRATGATLTDPANPEVRLIIPPNALQQDSSVGVTLLQSSEFLREDLPSLVGDAGDFVDVAGVFGEATNANVTLEVPNRYGLPVGTQVPFGKVDHNTLVWVDLRNGSPGATMGIVRARGSSTYIEVQFDRFCSICTGYCLPLALLTILDQTLSDVSPPQDCGDPGVISGNSAVNLREGFLTEEVRLPTMRELGGTFGLSLGYASYAAHPQVTLSSMTNYGTGRPIEATQYKFQIEGIMAEGIYDRTQGQTTVGTYIWEGRNAAGHLLQTGSYPYVMRITSFNAFVPVGLTSTFGGASTSSNTAILYPGLTPLRSGPIRGRTVLINKTGSPYGAGWSIQQEHRLHFDADGCVVLVYGNSQWLRFEPNGSGGWVSPRGDFSTLSFEAATGVYRRSFRDGTVYTFDRGGAVLTRADRYGHTTTFEHAGGRLVRVISPTGYWYSIAYDGAGKLASIVDSANRMTRFVVDGAGDLVQVTDAVGTPQLFSYGGGHLLVGQQGPRGERSEYVYFTGRLIMSRAYDTDGRTVLRERRFLPSALAGEIGEARRAGRGTMGNRIPVVERRVDRMVDGRGVIHEREADPDGKSIMVRDGLGRVTRFSYDSNRRLEILTRPNGSVAEYSHDAFGNVTSLIERTSSNSVYSTTNIEHNGPFSQMSRVVDAEGKQRGFVHDTIGNATAVLDHDGNATEYRYEDPLFPSLPTRVSLPTGDVITIGYDSHGNVATVTDYPDPVVDPNGRQWLFQADVTGATVAVVDPTSRRASIEYDQVGRVRRIVDPLMRRTELSYAPSSCACALAAVARVTFPDGTHIEYDYDGLIRLVAMRDQGGRARRAEWDAEGNPISVIDRNGIRMNYEWDAASQLIRKELPGDDVSIYVYDHMGLLTLASNRWSRVAAEYDFLGRPTSVTSSLVSSSSSVGLSHRLTYSYNRVGARVTVADDVGIVGQSWSYDNRHLPVALTSTTGQSWSFRYDPSGRRVAVLRSGGGPRSDYSYDRAGQLRAVVHGSLPPLDLRYEQYDRAGSLVANRTIVGLVGMDNLAMRGPLMELRSMSSSILQGDVRRTVAYQYDDSRHLLRDSEHEYLYDLEGRVVQRRDLTRDHWLSFDYDAEGRLVALQEVQGGGSGPSIVLEVAYRYDALGRRLQRVINGVSSSTFYDITSPIVFLDSLGRVEAAVIHGADGEDILASIDGITGIADFVLSDRSGSTVGRTSTNGILGLGPVHDEFGQMVLPGGAGHSASFGGFVGRPPDLESGLVYLGARMMDPKLGRFLSPDPLGLGPVANSYVYAGNNPQDRYDPTGQIAVPIGLAANVALGVLKGGLNAYNAQPGSAFQQFGLGFIDGALPFGGTISETIQQYDRWGWKYRCYDYGALGSAFVQDAIAMYLSKLATDYLPRPVGRPPDIEKWRRFSDWGVNSWKYLGREVVGGLPGLIDWW